MKENMSFDNDYPNRKDKRRSFTGSKMIAHSCRNHGNCEYCKRNRTINLTKVNLISKEKLKDID